MSAQERAQQTLSQLDKEVSFRCTSYRHAPELAASLAVLLECGV
jgi:hypothetical protein